MNSRLLSESERSRRTTPGRAAAHLPRRAARLFFRHHIENGLSVSLCLGSVALAAGMLSGLKVAVFASTGAMCISIVDQPGPIAGKARLFLAALAGTTLLSLMSGLADGTIWAMASVVTLTSLAMAMATAFGRPALTLAISGVLSLIIGMAAPVVDAAAALHQSALFLAGGAGYAALALFAAQLLNDRERRMFLNEALLAFARFLRSRARLYERVETPEAALAAVLEAHGAFMERLQSAREAIFRGHIGPRRRRWIAGMLALLDVYETLLSSDADWDSLRASTEDDTLHRVAVLIRAMAGDVEEVALSLVSPGAAAPPRGHDQMLAALDADLAKHSELRAGLQPTRDKLARGLRRTQRLAEVMTEPDEALTLPALDFAAFLQPGGSLLATLRRQLTLDSPVMRYAIRLTLAMLAGYGVTIAFPEHVHGGWILLTVALIMRASYAITRQRRNDRIIGTLAGCTAAAVVMPLLPGYALVAGIAIGVGTAHAFATVNYRVTSFAASFMALLLLHFLEPQTAFVADRILDTLIGAALSVLFSRVLPSWERRDVPRLVDNLVKADRAFAQEALTLPGGSEQSYRLARKRALDSFTALTMTTRRLASEPNPHAGELAQINRLLAANYLFASDLASVQ
ncbi:MAG TPA: FUSC family membrane protein, partial [Gammaproteobacteria bacterium]|nr:FUSC family membrane protein [Gammaproteobacteria bacterium]